MRPQAASLTEKVSQKVKGDWNGSSSRDCSIKACIAITFDDGPTPGVTPLILDILRRQEVKATFFVLGQQVQAYPDLLKRSFAEGHEIGNHTWSHQDLSRLLPSDVRAQLELTQQTIMKNGVPTPKIFRPPYGVIDDMIAMQNHLTVVRWNIDPEDWKIKHAGRISERIIAQARPGGIVLLHDVDPATAHALEPTLVALKPRYQFVTVSKLLNLTPGDQGQYFGQ